MSSAASSLRTCCPPPAKLRKWNQLYSLAADGVLFDCALCWCTPAVTSTAASASATASRPSFPADVAAWRAARAISCKKRGCCVRWRYVARSQGIVGMM
jgi:hypothetical protein